MADMEALSPADTAQARSRLYALFARLYREGLSPALLPLAAELPGLAEVLPDPYDEDEAAALHYRLLGREIPAHESFFLGVDGLLGGPLADAVQASYSAVGFAPHASAAGVDAIGEELDLLAFLSGAEADARTDGRPQVAQQMAALQSDFLADHLLRWLFPFVLAVQEMVSPFYSGLAELTVALAAEQTRGVTLTRPGQDAVSLPAAPDLLDDERAGLGEIAAFFTTPSSSGIFLSRATLATIARRLRLPRGFGARAQMLDTFLRAAAQYEQLPAAVDALHAILDGWHARYAALIDDSPHLRPFIRPWQTQIGPARRLLRGLLKDGVS